MTDYIEHTLESGVLYLSSSELGIILHLSFFGAILLATLSLYRSSADSYKIAVWALMSVCAFALLVNQVEQQFEITTAPESVTTVVLVLGIGVFLLALFLQVKYGFD
ncbi:hypothetical protein [Natronorubrum tibetense]|uniref:Uncharacterized protein n=1 Tax=Natronorubrum tibetense GA33 TaxID=1114856 RepID=L9W3X7_9EURY|nr:hypothetical protein [Natronorubrum tibetense]ELY43043.1 hypothetical protein C496_06902 [Natronorubrum tibetense GA33]